MTMNQHGQDDSMSTPLKKLTIALDQSLQKTIGSSSMAHLLISSSHLESLCSLLYLHVAHDYSRGNPWFKFSTKLLVT